MTYDTDDAHNLALVAWKEARGEGIEGMDAVMHVCYNRVGKPGFAHTIHDVIYGKNQFTSMSVPSDPEYNLQPSDTDTMYGNAIAMAGPVLSGTEADPTCGAHYYADLKYTTSGWFVNAIVNNPTAHPQVAVIGRHTFYF